MSLKRIVWTLLAVLITSSLVFFSAARAQEPVIQAVLFYSPTCGHCKIVIEEVLPDLDARYGSQLQIYGVNTYTDVGNYLYTNFANEYGIALEDQVVPALLVGNQVLFGSQQIPDELPGIIDAGLAAGGIPWPELTGLPEAMAGSLEISSADATSIPGRSTLLEKFSGDLAGNTLAVIVLIGMLASLAYAGIQLTRGSANLRPLPAWLVPVLSLLGTGVAAYLSYVEYNQVEAVCGPVGNCNAVQQSSFATLFGILPVGILGLLGYLGILLAWLFGQLDLGGKREIFDLALWAGTLLGTLFSIYLTFLEPFVIGATCIWCLSSAIIMTALFLTASRKLDFSGD